MSTDTPTAIPTLLNADQVAERLDVSTSTFYRMVSSGEFPRGLKRNRKWTRWTPDDVAAYLQKLADAAGRHQPALAATP